MSVPANHIEPSASGEPKAEDRGLFWEVHRPASYWDVVAKHLLLAFLTVVPLLLSALVPLERLPLIPCLFLRFTGLPCPFCGYTRSFWAMMRGDWHFVFVNAPLAGLLFLAAALVLGWNLAGLLSGRIFSRGRLLRIPRRTSARLTLAAVILILLQWVYRLYL